ncbi:MAG: PA2169 family four-helix-bundle protein [Bacteroidota bacterium]
MQSEDKATDYIRTLIMVNNDRQSAFETALNEVEDENLKSWFKQMSDQGKCYRDELINQIPQELRKSHEFTYDTLSGRIYKLWMDIKHLVSKHNTHAILSSCEFGEDSALRIYNEALENKEIFSDEVYEIIHRHMLKIKEDFNILMKLRKLEESEV